MLTQIRNIRKTIVPTQMPMFILKMCVYTGSISAMKHTTHVTLAPYPSTPPGIQSAENTGDDHNSVSESYPGSFMLLI